MGTLKNITQQRALPVPTGVPSLHFVPWSFGQMRPLACSPYQITVNNVPQKILDVFIPANTWAEFKRLLIWADCNLKQNGGAHPGGRQYSEGQEIQSGGIVNRSVLQNIANSANDTRYVIQRQYQSEFGGNVYEENWDTIGIATLFQVQNVDHRKLVTAGFLPYDRTLDAYLSLYVWNTFAGSTDVMYVHTAQAYIQAPYDLNRLPR